MSLRHRPGTQPGPAAVLAAVGLALLAGPASAFKPAPVRVIQCPGSSEIRQVTGMASGNTLGGKFWSDGYWVAPMLPDLPQITRCTADGPIFWLSSAQLLGILGQEGAPLEWQHAPVVRALEPEELLEALAQGLGDTTAHERYLRLHAWWAGNAKFRQVQGSDAAVSASDFPMGSAGRANLEALLRLHDGPDPAERLLKAEMLRELGRFDEAQALLPPEPPQQAPLHAHWILIRDRLAARDARVARLPATR